MKKNMASVSKSATKALVRRMLKEHDLASRELKYYTIASSGVASASGTVWAITQGIIQGDQLEQRDGIQINVTSLKVDVQASMGPAATTDEFRIIVFKDLMCKGTVPTVTELLDTTSVLSGYNVYWKQSNRFKIYVDEMCPMSINGDTRKLSKRYSFKTGLTKVEYLGTTDVAAANGPNSYFMLIIDDLGANNATYGFSWNLTYYDS